jgi:hypothetical protein
MFLIRRCNIKRKSNQYISYCPSLWGEKLLFSNTLKDTYVTYSLRIYAATDCCYIEQHYGIKCRIEDVILSKAIDKKEKV